MYVFFFSNNTKIFVRIKYNNGIKKGFNVSCHLLIPDFVLLTIPCKFSCLDTKQKKNLKKCKRKKVFKNSLLNYYNKKNTSPIVKDFNTNLNLLFELCKNIHKTV